MNNIMDKEQTEEFKSILKDISLDVAYESDIYDPKKMVVFSFIPEKQFKKFHKELSLAEAVSECNISAESKQYLKNNNYYIVYLSTLEKDGTFFENDLDSIKGNVKNLISKKVTGHYFDNIDVFNKTIDDLSYKTGVMAVTGAKVAGELIGSVFNKEKMKSYVSPETLEKGKVQLEKGKEKISEYIKPETLEKGKEQLEKGKEKINDVFTGLKNKWKR